jgi:hypothetical protein
MLSVDNPFYRQVVLLVELLPLVAREPCFALKGGTAINLFVRDLPRLSVDIDLTYLPIEGREERAKSGSDAEDVHEANDRLAHDDLRTTQVVYRRKPRRARPGRKVGA